MAGKEDDILNEVKQAKSNRETMSAYNIDTDKLHRFVTDEQIKEYNSKISTKDLEDALENLKKTLENDFNKKYDNIYNTPEIYKSIKKLSALCDTDKNILNLLLDIRNTNIADELNDHINSGIHIKQSDRDALDNLKFVIGNSYADWNADEADINYIKNKPKALKADGGNADTVGGYSADQLMCGSKSDTVIIGCNNKIDCDYYIEDTTEDIAYIIQPIINNMKKGGSILFREGNYNISTLNIFNDYIRIRGVGMATKLNVNSFKITASQFTLNSCNLFVDLLSIKGINILIKYNRITNTGSNNIKIEGLIDSIIKDNFLINISQLYHYGNIISDNIYC